MGNTASHTVAGHTSAAASSVTIDEVPATITSGTNFSASVPMPGSTNVVAVVAQPSAAGGTTATQFYQIVNSGGTLIPLTYDADGNCTQDENGNKYRWDALDRMTKITYPNGTTSNFAYDGLSRRVSIVEKNAAGGVVTTKNYLWIGSEIAEERDASNNVTKRFFPQGEQQIVGGTASPYYYTRDHLGSVRELLNSSGTIVARYSYDPYGRTTLVSGSNLATFQYAHTYAHQVSGLMLTKYRAYDASAGRWLSRDPLNEAEQLLGPNLYEYVTNNPANKIDPLGLDPIGEPQELLPDAIIEAQVAQALGQATPAQLALLASAAALEAADAATSFGEGVEQAIAATKNFPGTPAKS